MWEVREISKRGGRRLWRVAESKVCGMIAGEYADRDQAQAYCDELDDEEEKAAALENAAALIAVHEEKLAIYRLFQAAPELLAACELILPYLPDQKDAQNEATANEGRSSEYTAASLRIRRAVARARGTASAPVSGLREITPTPKGA